MDKHFFRELDYKWKLFESVTKMSRRVETKYELAPDEVTPWEPKGESIEKQYFYELLDEYFDTNGQLPEVVKMTKRLGTEDVSVFKEETESFTEMAFVMGVANSIIEGTKEELLEGFQEALEDNDMKQAIFYIIAYLWNIRNRNF